MWLILVSFILVSTTFCFGFVSAEPTSLSSGSDFVIDEDETITISGPEYSVKGNILIRQGGTLSIHDTDFEIFQQYSDQYGIELEQGATLELVDSNLRSEKSLDFELNTGSRLKVVGSSLHLPGEIIGSAESVASISSDIRAKNINLNLGSTFSVEDTVIETEKILLSSPRAYLNTSVIRSELIFHSDTQAELYGSSFENIEVRSGEARVFGRLYLSVEDLIGVPVGGAEMEAERIAEEDWFYVTETDNKGEWIGYLISETIDSERSRYKGNYHISVEHEGIEEKTTISLPPVERRTPERDLDEIDVWLEMKLPNVVSSTTYYDDSNFDLFVNSTRERMIETYPNEGIDNFVQEGNVYLADQGSLMIGEHSRVRILQKEDRYRIEMRDSSELLLKKNSSIVSDGPLNIYVLDDSTLSLQGAHLEVSSIYMTGSSNLVAENAHIDAEHVHFQGESFILRDSVMESRSLNVEAHNVIMEGSQVSTDKNVTLDANSFESLEDLEFDHAVFFESDTLDELTVTNLTAPNIIPQEGLTVNRKWHLYMEIFNGHDRLVPFVDLNIYRNEPLQKELIESVLVKDGRMEVPLKSEVITNERSRFVGNYVLRAEKNVNSEVMMSETSLIAVDGNTETEVRFKDEFPYSIVMDVDMPSKVEPGELFEIQGRATYQGADLEVENATVEVEMIAQDQRYTWNTTTDAMGRFDIEIEAPTTVSDHSVDIRVYDEYMRMESEERFSLKVERDTESSMQNFLFLSTMGRFITVLIIVVLLILAYKITTTLFEKEYMPMSYSDRSNEITEKILNEE